MLTIQFPYLHSHSQNQDSTLTQPSFSTVFLTLIVSIVQVPHTKMQSSNHLSTQIYSTSSLHGLNSDRPYSSSSIQQVDSQQGSPYQSPSDNLHSSALCGLLNLLLCRQHLDQFKSIDQEHQDSSKQASYLMILQHLKYHQYVILRSNTNISFFVAAKAQILQHCTSEQQEDLPSALLLSLLVKFEQLMTCSISHSFFVHIPYQSVSASQFLILLMSSLSTSFSSLFFVLQTNELTPYSFLPLLSSSSSFPTAFLTELFIFVFLGLLDKPGFSTIFTTFSDASFFYLISFSHRSQTNQHLLQTCLPQLKIIQYLIIMV